MSMVILAPAPIERHIVLGRVILSVAAIVSVWIDPTTPSLSHWVRVTGGLFMIDGPALAVLSAHLAYALGCWRLDVARPARGERRARLSVVADVLFGVAVAIVTEGATSPAYVFFAFAILAAGARAGARVILAVTTACVAFYLGIILASDTSGASLFMMRPIYLAITGGLVAYLAQRRLDCEQRVREAETRAERHSIARVLHDGYVQALAAVNVRLENCRVLLDRDRREDASTELAALQCGVRREYDEVRSYVRSLAALGRRDDGDTDGREPRCTVAAEIEGSGIFVEHALLIMLEGVRNVRRHARATSSRVVAAAGGDGVRITIADDGVGFAGTDEIPWTIASRARDCGGVVRVGERARRGGEIIVELPRA
ncbi:MAG: hypothetical protein IT293_13535 [Deltaproteobacteria bacterium]|nr:hypothetical protein [Deltaproteobacteria bacterium]